MLLMHKIRSPHCGNQRKSNAWPADHGTSRRTLERHPEQSRIQKSRLKRRSALLSRLSNASGAQRLVIGSTASGTGFAVCLQLMPRIPCGNHRVASQTRHRSLNRLCHRFAGRERNDSRTQQPLRGRSVTSSDSSRRFPE